MKNTYQTISFVRFLDPKGKFDQLIGMKSNKKKVLLLLQNSLRCPDLQDKLLMKRASPKWVNTFRVKASLKPNQHSESASIKSDGA